LLGLSKVEVTCTPRAAAASIASAISLHVMVNTQMSRLLRAAPSSAKTAESEVGRCSYVQCLRWHVSPRRNARHGNPGSGKKRARCSGGGPAAASMLSNGFSLLAAQPIVSLVFQYGGASANLI
jgi:hypothetical protein